MSEWREETRRPRTREMEQGERIGKKRGTRCEPGEGDRRGEERRRRARREERSGEEHSVVTAVSRGGDRPATDDDAAPRSDSQLLFVLSSRAGELIG